MKRIIISLCILFVFVYQMYGQQIQRKILLEQFTTESCVMCPRGHALLEKILHDRDDVIWFSHHSGYGEDDYTTPHDLEYLWFYNDGKYTFAPAMMLDRTKFENTYPGLLSDVISEPDVTALLQKAAEVPALVSVNIYGVYQEETQTIKVQVSGKATVDELPGCTDLRLTIFLTEDSIKSSKQKGKTESIYTHNGVTRDVLTQTFGDPAYIIDGEFFSEFYIKNLDAKWNPENMNIIACLSNYNAKNVTKCMVYNSEITTLKGLSLPPDNIESMQGVTNHLYITEGMLHVWGNSKVSGIYALTGNLIKCFDAQSDSYDIGEIANGIYLVKVMQDQQIKSYKIAIGK